MSIRLIHYDDTDCIISLERSVIQDPLFENYLEQK
jgi:hypothetical protein